MIMLLSAWLVATLSEFLLYKYLPEGALRRWWAVFTVALLVGATVGLLAYRWPVWLVAALFTCYRVVGIVRTLQNRLPRAELRRMSLRALGWLLVAQAAGTGLCWLAAEYMGVAAWGLEALLALQLVCAVVLLRVSVKTWLHTRPSFTDTTLTDKELPSVSVLVPARDETDALQACLEKLVASDYPKLEIIVLDDCSANRRTPEIIRGFAHAGVRFIQGAVPDETRWLAKNQAYEELRLEASGSLLVFCGVDVQFGPGSIRELVEMMHHKHKDMLSVLPLRAEEARAEASLLQPMRYFWELCLPRRMFKRPPVLSSCWAIRAEALARDGGFEAVSRSVVPEAHFARQAVIGDRYSFVRANQQLAIISTKPASEQFETTVRMRYPQLHRRLELVALTTMVELLFLLGPMVGLALAWLIPHPTGFVVVWLISTVLLQAVYFLVAVRTKLNAPWLSWALFPAAVVLDVVMLHVSMWKYEFGQVPWRGRNVCIPVMQVVPSLPPLPKR
jgi:chlorobactene glucosyltransferase